ncbi:MAG: class I SAM-dependent methyltransferase [Cyanobacteriota bacterium]
MNFTAHNILLNNKNQTIDNKELLENTEQCKAFIRTLNNTFPNKELRNNIIIADLGCLEGGYSFAFAKEGYKVLGFDAREDNIKKCNYVKSNYDISHELVNFIKDDIRNITNYGKFDVIFCCGLLYHLDEPVSYLKLLGPITKKLLILHTHYSTINNENSFFNKIKRKTIIGKNIKIDYGLSKLEVNEGKRGRWYIEFTSNDTIKKIEKENHRSYGNEKSFWLYKEDLLQTIIESGFNIVYEQYDFLDKISDNVYIDNYDRSLIGIKI